MLNKKAKNTEGVQHHTNPPQFDKPPLYHAQFFQSNASQKETHVTQMS
jgi:hypothetical protein